MQVEGIRNLARSTGVVQARRGASAAKGRLMQSVTPSQDSLDFYATPSDQTSPGRRAALFQGLPDNVDELRAIVQGLFVYDVVANDYYGFQPPKLRLEEIHVRSVEAMLEKIRQLEETPLSQRRPFEHRMVARCDHFVRMLIGML